MRRTVFKRLLLSLIAAVLFITLVTGTLVYSYVNSTLKQEVYSSNIEILGQTKKIVEIALGEIQQTASSLILNRDVQRALWLKWDMNEEYRFLENINDTFRDKVASSRYIQSVYLYSTANGKVISNSGIVDLDGFWYASSIRRFLDEPVFSNWYDTSELVSASGSKENIISYVTSVPASDRGKAGILVINLKEDLLYDAVININNRKLGNVAIINRDGHVLSYKDKSILFTRLDAADSRKMKGNKEGYLIENMNGTEMFVSYIISDFNGWQYVALNPSKEVFQKSNAVLQMTLTISGLCLAVGLLLMALVSGRHYSPIKKMMQAISPRMNQLGDVSAFKDEFSYIQRSFDNLWNQNEKFRSQFLENELILRDHFLLNLVLGKPADAEETKRQIEYYKLDLTPQHYLVLVLRVHDKEQPNGSQEQLINMASYHIRAICEEAIALYARGVVINEVQKREIVLLNFDDGAAESEALDKAREIAVYIRTQVEEQLALLTSIGIGGYYEQARDIHLSYNEAQEALLYERMEGIGSLISIRDLMLDSVNRNAFIAYRNAADKMMSELKTGHLDKALDIKDSIMEQLNGQHATGHQYKHMILTDMVNGIVTVIFELNGQIEDVFGPGYNIYYEFGRQASMPMMQTWFHTIMEQTADYIQRKRDNKNAELVQKVTEYIRGSCAEPHTLQSVADAVFMNAHYFSKVFKEVSGWTFGEYLAEIRLQEACRLLKETNGNIIDIAAASGFGQKQNMIRAFKKSFGMTPTEYRKMGVFERLADGTNTTNDTNLKI
ncbi:helix-turn-helix domain-containing protein [Paenibacillus thalictri]|uniref:AraC family transcriptional regulator n=1 Tax=Paenibacillus thalictri TaxID=2527873 RepID=A0A4Q9DQ31_9BACL|nr:helix-turn-helix domain-containing protein [Paenibacillus thalictri]TBL78508.1 AraC family transcriptional regulator [Paenibacillus thalictri]